MASRASRSLKPLLVLAVLLLIVYLARPLWLSVLGHSLVHNDGPAKADIAVVLAGDYYGRRIEKAAEMVRQGYVPAALVDGPSGFYGTDESSIAIQYIVKKGYPVEGFIHFPINATSTLAEAQLVVPELRRRQIRSYLLVTSDFHSARAARVFRSVQRALGYNPAMRVVVVDDRFFSPDNWWHSREGRKAVFLEWSKTVAEALGQ